MLIDSEWDEIEYGVKRRKRKDRWEDGSIYAETICDPAEDEGTEEQI